MSKYRTENSYMKNRSRLKFSCVLDSSPLIAIQSYIWLQNLLANGFSPKIIYIHIVGSIAREYESYLQEIGINIIKCEAFDDRNKFCNKLIQLQTFENIKDYDYVFLMDCDTAVLSLEGLKLNENIYAKIVDFPNPPLEILKEIFNINGFTIEESKSSFSLNNDNITDWNNCNGGVYIIHRDFLPVLAPKWKEYAIKCINERETFSPGYAKHADQVGFALAMASLNKKVSHLDINWNFPIHVETKGLDVDAKILHFHDRINDQIKLLFTSNEIINLKITHVNSIISKSLRKSHVNSIFWNFRYHFFPELGRGIGSRGESLIYKRKLLKKSLPEPEKYSVLDVGCGDLEVMKIFPFSNYLGLDLSTKTLELAKVKRPDWNFELINNSTFNYRERDVVICLDVLIHQKSFLRYKQLIDLLVSHTRHRLIIAAYENKPEISSDITFYYESISKTLKSTGKFKSIAKLGEYRSTSFIVADTHEFELKNSKSVFSIIRKYIG